MSWSQRIFLPIGSAASAAIAEPNLAQSRSDISQTSTARRSAALTPEPRLHQPQLPLEYVGLNGEYDPQGLAKRVARAFDQHPEMHQLNTLCILQQGNRISLLGKVTTPGLLQAVVDCVKQVEGVQAVDVSQVSIEQALSPVVALNQRFN